MRLMKRIVCSSTFVIALLALAVSATAQQAPSNSKEKTGGATKTREASKVSGAKSQASKSAAKDGEKTADAAAKAREVERQRAIGVVESVYARARDFEDERVRIRVQAQAADLLWDVDEGRARRMFEEAFAQIERMKASAPASPQGEMAFLAALAGTPQTQLRGEVLRYVARRDARLAEKLIESLPREEKEASKNKETKDANAVASTESSGAGANASDEGKSGDADKTNETDAKKKSDAMNDALRSLSPFGTAQRERGAYYMQIAASLVEVDPQRAVDFARRGLNESGLSFLFPSVLFALRLKDPSVADALYNDALLAARRDPANAQMNISLLVNYALPNYGGAAKAMRDMMALNPQMKNALTSNTTVAANFLEFAFEMLTANDASGANAQSDLYLLRQLLPSFEKYLPARLEAVRQRLEERSQKLTDAEREALNKNEQDESVSDLMQKAEKATVPAQKDVYTLRAAMKALSDSDEDAALDLIEKVKNETQREMYKPMLRMQAAVRALAKGDAEKALRYAREISEPIQRASLFALVAQKLAEKKENARALEIVSEAQRLTERADDNAAKTQALLTLAAVAAPLDAERGFEAAGAAVSSINNTETNAKRAGEKKSAVAAFAQAFGGAFGVDLLNFDQSLGALARADFERGLSLAQTIRTKEVSVIAQLAVCRAALAPPQK